MPMLADIHNHALFGLDDGAVDLDTSLAMLARSYEEGVRLLCLTPHCNPDLFPHATREAAEENFARLSEAAAARFPELSLALGNELLAYGITLDAVRSGRCMPLGESSTLLMEFVPDIAFSDLLNTLRAARSMGHRVLLAHVERYGCLLREPGRVADLKAAHVRIQINAASTLLGPLSPIGRFTRRLLKQGLVDVVASDAHGLRHRPPELLEAYRRVSAVCDSETADALFYQNPKKLLSAKPSK